MVLGDVEDHDLVGCARAVHVELHRLFRRAVLLFNRFVVGHHGHGVLEVLGVDAVNGDLDRSNALRVLRFRQVKFENVAFAEPPQRVQVVPRACNQPALHAEIPDGRGQSGFGVVEIFLG